MELLLTIIFFAAFVYGIYKWAESKGRNPVGWAIAAALVSPLIVGIILLFVPKTLEKQAEEAKKMKELMET
jgi:fructose-specific phosphotransferase system IIC component